jgi:peptide/nickel transport system ATP-binding protein
MVTPALEVSGLCLGLPHGRSLVRDIALDLNPGECVGLVGQSGAGKSLTASALCGLLPPPVRITEGRIFLAGQEVDWRNNKGWSGLRGRGVLLIMQDAALCFNPTRRLGSQIEETLRAARVDRGEVRQLADIALSVVGLHNACRRAYPHELSGGMRRRVLLALVWALKPRVIIADEPTAGLDAMARSEVFSLLRRLCEEEGSALLLVSHDLRSVSRLATRVGVMQAGSLVELGPSAQVLSRPRHPHAQKLLACLRAIEDGHA